MLIFGYVLLLIILGYSICRLDFKDPEQLRIALASRPQISYSYSSSTFLCWQVGSTLNIKILL